MKVKAVYVAAVMIFGSTALAAAQGGSTDRNGNAMGSQHVGNGTARMHSGTVGMNRAGRGDPNGAPGGAPKAKGGPQGDASKDADAPK